MLHQAVLSVLSGGLVGLALGATGSGGSIIAIPLLVYLVGSTVQQATMMSLVVVAASASVGVYEHFKTGELRIRAASVFGLSGIPGSWLGVYGHRLVREELMLLLFGLVMVLAAVQMWRRSRQDRDRASGAVCVEQFPSSCVPKVALIGLCVGVLTGFFGVGGGFIIVPVLTLALGFPLRVAMGTSLLIIATVAIGALFGHLRSGSIDVSLTSYLLIGGITGVLSGTKLGSVLSPQSLVRMFAALAGAIGVSLIIHNAIKVIGTVWM